MKCVLIDDEPMDLMALSELMSTYDEIEIVGKFHNPIEAKDFVNKSKVDVIVLDVEMPELNGIDFIKSIKNVEHIILISSNKTYAAESYDYNVTDYIVKPISKKRLGLAIEKVKLVDDSIKTSSNRDFAFVKDGTKIIRIDFKEILFIEALADYVQINTEHGRYTVLATMKSMPDFGARLGMEYGKRSNEIGRKLVSDGVAFNEADVNTVMLTGFFHAYGPVNDYFVY